jgi:hypothetical protein
MATKTPNNIHMIEDAIKECELRIENLTNQLKEAQKERQRWEIQLASAKGRDYFNKCPVEILIKIFQLYLARNHQAISSLLLVCKRWYELVMKNPSLWNRIHLGISFTPGNQPFRLVPYIQACKQRSENLKLDITLDLKDITDAREWHRSLIEILLKEECNDCLSWVVSDFTYRDGSDYQYHCSRFEQRIENMVKIMRVLVGEGSKDMARWSTLRIALPRYQEYIRAIVPIFSLLNGTTHSLRDLAIDGSDEWDNPSNYEELEDLENLEALKQFPSPIDCSQLERLAISSVHFNNNPVQWSNIKHLDVAVALQSDLSIISDIVSLETLKIRIPNLYDSRRQTGQVVEHCFSHLHSLTVTGRIPNDWFEVFNLDAPVLRHFSVQLCDNGRYDIKKFDVKFPQISPQTVIFRYEDDFDSEENDSEENDSDDSDSSDNDSRTSTKGRNYTDSEKAIRRVLHHFSSAKQIIFGNFPDEMIHTALTEMIENGQQCPLSVYTERKGDFCRLHHAETI